MATSTWLQEQKAKKAERLAAEAAAQAEEAANAATPAPPTGDMPDDYVDPDMVTYEQLMIETGLSAHDVWEIAGKPEGDRTGETSREWFIDQCYKLHVWTEAMKAEADRAEKFNQAQAILEAAELEAQQRAQARQADEAARKTAEQAQRQAKREAAAQAALKAQQAADALAAQQAADAEAARKADEEAKAQAAAAGAKPTGRPTRAPKPGSGPAPAPKPQPAGANPPKDPPKPPSGRPPVDPDMVSILLLADETGMSTSEIKAALGLDDSTSDQQLVSRTQLMEEIAKWMNLMLDAFKLRCAGDLLSIFTEEEIVELRAELARHPSLDGRDWLAEFDAELAKARAGNAATDDVEFPADLAAVLAEAERIAAEAAAEITRLAEARAKLDQDIAQLEADVAAAQLNRPAVFDPANDPICAAQDAHLGEFQMMGF